MKLATHRTTTVPRKGPTIVQKYKKGLEARARAGAIQEQERLLDIATRDYLGITRKEYRRHTGLYFTHDIKAWEGLKAHRLAQALQGPQLPPPEYQGDSLNYTAPCSMKWYEKLTAFICR